MRRLYKCLTAGEEDGCLPLLLKGENRESSSLSYTEQLQPLSPFDTNLKRRYFTSQLRVTPLILKRRFQFLCCCHFSQSGSCLKAGLGFWRGWYLGNEKPLIYFFQERILLFILN